MISRRNFLEFMGGATAVSLLSSCLMFEKSKHFFNGMQASNKDDVILANGLKYKHLISWGDPINRKGQKFGFNNDFISLQIIDENNALMLVNHESVNPIFVSNYFEIDGRGKTKAQVDIEKSNVGFSSMKISRKSKSDIWAVDYDNALNNRIDGHTKIPFSKKQKVMGSSYAVGTLSNCAGGKTSWGTFLTCEENYYKVYGESSLDNGKRRIKSYIHKNSSWEAQLNSPPEHYGWVVEYDPKTKESKKLISLGRFCHEGATTTLAADGRTVVYMADDAKNEHIYKFISEESGSLEEGQLFVANTIKGEWLELSYSKNKKLQKEFESQLEVLMYARKAAKILGATPLDRPEDIAINPTNGDIFIALTNNKKNLNFHGSLLKISEANNSNLALNFKAETFMLGGQSSAFSCPDNLVFDKNGNLWITTDITGKLLNKFPYTQFKNNGLFYIPLSGKYSGQVYQIASAPNEAEFTGPCFSDDYKTLFLSVQHPGEESLDLKKPTSTWNTLNGSVIPRPGVIMLSGPLLEQIIG